MRHPPHTAPLDPRDLAGTDDHTRLIHPHGDAVSVVGVYTAGDLASYLRACTAAHDQISGDHLRAAEHARIPPLCRGIHVETLLDGIGDLPHSVRALLTAEVSQLEAVTGRPVGFLRAWRHVGDDCTSAETGRGCRH